jgi:hypothetical protein
MPLHQVALPLYRVTMPLHRVALPLHRVTMPLHRVALPLHRVTMPLQGVALPLQGVAKFNLLQINEILYFNTFANSVKRPQAKASSQSHRRGLTTVARIYRFN